MAPYRFCNYTLEEGAERRHLRASALRRAGRRQQRAERLLSNAPRFFAAPQLFPLRAPVGNGASPPPGLVSLSRHLSQSRRWFPSRR